MKDNYGFEVLARFVTRPNYEHPVGWDMAIMMPFVSAAESKANLKPNTVYNLVEILGQLVIREVGPSCLSADEIPLIPGLTWAASFEQVIICTDNMFLLTKEEVEHIIQRRKNHEGNVP